MCADATYWRRLALRDASRELCGVKILNVNLGEDDSERETPIVIGWPRGLIPLQKSASHFAIEDLTSEDNEEEEVSDTEMDVQIRERHGHVKRRYSTSSAKVTMVKQDLTSSSRSASFSLGANSLDPKAANPFPRSESFPVYPLQASFSCSSPRPTKRTTPLLNLEERKSQARVMRGREGYFIRKEIFEEERVLRRVMSEPLVLTSSSSDRVRRSRSRSRSRRQSESRSISRGSGASSSASSISTSSSKPRSIKIDLYEPKEVEEGKLLSVCWEGRWRSQMASSW